MTVYRYSENPLSTQQVHAAPARALGLPLAACRPHQRRRASPRALALAAMSAEQLAAFKARRAEILESGMGLYKQLGDVPVYKDLKKECAHVGLKPCASMACRTGVHPLANFYEKKKADDKLSTYCKDCHNGPGARAAADASKARKRAVAEMVEAEGPKKTPGATEDEAREWFVRNVCDMAGLKSAATLEFRTADMAVRRAAWQEDTWIPIQVKSDGKFKDDGITLKPNDSSSGIGGGRAGFHDCLGYQGMLVVCIKTRFDTTTSPDCHTVWVMNGDDVTKNILMENADGTLGPGRVQPLQTDSIIAEFASIVDASVLPRVNWETINLQVTDVKQRKEIVLMRALRVAGYHVKFIPGNQTSVDCVTSPGGNMQMKTFKPTKGNANAGHRKNGVAGMPYDEDDPIDTLAEAFIVARQPKHHLLVNGIFAHNGYAGRRPSPGSTTISVPLGIFQVWIKGGKRSREVEEQCKWLNKPAFGWRPPVEVTAQSLGLPQRWLDDAANEAAKPSAFPSASALEHLELMIEQSDASVQAGDDRRAAEAAAARSEAAANRAEAAASSGAGPSQVTNNINVNYNATGDIHIHQPPEQLDVPPGKRRLTQSTLPFGPR
jgi:hypothetical protein